MTPETEGVCNRLHIGIRSTRRKPWSFWLIRACAEKDVPEGAVNDLARCDMAEAVEDAFRYDKLVLATTTYNSDISRLCAIVSIS